MGNQDKIARETDIFRCLRLLVDSTSPYKSRNDVSGCFGANANRPIPISFEKPSKIFENSPNSFKSIQIDRNPYQNRDFARKSRFFKFWSSLARSRPTRHSGSVPNVSAMFRECFRSEITRRGGRDNKNIGGGPRGDAYRKSTKMHRLRSGRSSLLDQILPSPSIGIRLKKNKNIFCQTKKNVRTPIYQYKLLIKQSGAGYQPVKSISKMYEIFPGKFLDPDFPRAEGEASMANHRNHNKK